MTGLHRTDLTTSQKVEFSAKAVAGQTTHGTITQLSNQFKLSRPTVYSVQGSVHKVLEAHFEKPEVAYKTTRVEVDETQLHRAIIALRVIAPNSLRAIEDLLPIVYPGLKVSYGVIQRILSDAEEDARDVNQRVELSAIKQSALDEMFSQGDPVLAGIDLASGYLHSLELKANRSADDWVDVLDKGRLQGLGLEVVVKDAALGIAAGVTQSFPQAEQRDDCFHVLYEMNKLRQKLSRKAYAAIEAEHQKQKELEKKGGDGQTRQRLQKALSQASETAQRRIERYDRFEDAVHLITEAMEYVDLETGTLYTGHAIQKMMLDASRILHAIEHHECKKMATYIHNRASGIALAAHALDKEFNALMSEYTLSDLSLACLMTRLAKQLKKDTPVALYHKPYQFFLGLYARLEQQVGAKTDLLFKTLNTLLDNRYRASSAIEGFNAALRPYLYVQKGVTQNFLELFRAYYNLRSRRWGRHKGTSAHECITGNAVGDWLSFLGYPVSTPSTLTNIH